jgi:hypothetical protein
MRTREGNLWARGLLSGLIVLLLASGCGGVDSGGTGAVAVGPVAGLGSIIVNGVRFDDSAAVIQDDDGAPLTRDRLLLGVVSRVDASAPKLVAGILRATASSILVSSQLIGPVSTVDTVARTLSVLGQSVLVTPATVFGAGFAGGLASVPVGATVEIYGRYDAANARYTATRIEARPNPAYYKVRGPIAAVDQVRATLSIGGLTIDYSRIPPGDILNVAVGKIVRAKLQPVAPSAVAIAVALPSGVVPLPDGAAATIEGRISAFVSSRMFSVDGTPVDATAASFPQGETGVVLGARVVVQGVSSAGTLHAQTVTVEGDENSTNSRFELHGTIDAIDSVAKTLSLRGLTVDYSGPLEFSGGTAADLAVGRQIEVDGILSSDGTTIKAQEIDFGS